MKRSHIAPADCCQECNNCVKAGRICLGYKSDATLHFRHYVPHTEEIVDLIDEVHLSPPESQSSSSSLSPVQSLFCDKDDDHIERRALITFFNEYCVPSQNPTLSRGFLDGLQSLIVYDGHGSELTEAAKTVSLAALGNRLQRPVLLARAKQKYSCLLGNFQSTLSNPATSKSIQALMTAVLLGLYEIITGNEYSPGMHDAHVRGVAAILDDDHSPFELSAGVRLFQLGNSMCLKEPLKALDGPGVLCAPAHNKPVTNLDAILIKFNPLYQRAVSELLDEGTSTEAMERLRRDLLQVVLEFKAWPQGQPDEWQPRVAGCVGDDHNCCICWRGIWTAYLDLYVAAAWNTYRKSHLLKLELLVRCTERLGESSAEARSQAERLAEDIVGSAAFHLISNLYGHLEHSEVAFINKTAGGLLLMHPLWVVLRCRSAVSQELRTHARSLLAWIGEFMGIGQAKQLSARGEDMPFKYVAQGHVIIWAGMLIHPA